MAYSALYYDCAPCRKRAKFAGLAAREEVNAK